MVRVSLVRRRPRSWQVEIHSMCGRMVDMALNIKDPEAHRLAKEIAAATGASMTKVVTEALRERWLREQAGEGRRSPEERVQLIDRALRIGRDCAKRLERAGVADNPDDLLFDELGLPRTDGDGR